MKQLLEEFDSVLKLHNPYAYEKLNPPLSNNEIEKNMIDIGIDEQDIRLIYQWKNGMDEQSDELTMRYGNLLSFDSAKELISENNTYDPLLIPIISDNGEETLLFNTKVGQHYGKIYLYSIPQLYINHPVSIYDSLTTMLETIIDAYKAEAYKYDNTKGMLLIDNKKLKEISRKNNTKSIFWTTYDPLKWKDWYAI